MKIISILAMSIASISAAQATTITEWQFNSTVTAPDNSPTASIGTGTATALGMTNNYSTNADYPTMAGSVNNDDVANNTTTTDAVENSSSGNGYAWRIRGLDDSLTPKAANNVTGQGNGWSSAAPIGTQGAEFDVSTVGYTNINVSFDLYVTTQGEAKFQLEYTTDLNDGSNAVWTNASDLSYGGTASGSILTNTTSANTVQGTYFDVSPITTGNESFFNNLSANLSVLNTAVENNANFGIRIVNAATGADDVNTEGNALNNNSGNVRFANVAFTGTATSAVPVPGAVWLFGSALAGFVGFKRRKSA